MVSFIYECLDEIFHSSAVARFLYLQKGSEEVRREIRTAARLIITFPFEEVVRIIPSCLMFGHSLMLTSILLKAFLPDRAIRRHQ